MVRIPVTVALVLMSVIGCEVQERDSVGDGAAEPDAGAHKPTRSMDAGGSAPDGGTPTTDAAMDGSSDATTEPSDAGSACVVPLDCSMTDCTLGDREDDAFVCRFPWSDWSAYYEGTCGAYHYRKSTDGLVSSTSYYRLDTDELVARRETTDVINGYCDGSTSLLWIGDIDVIQNCEVETEPSDNLCCQFQDASCDEDAGT